MTLEQFRQQNDCYRLPDYFSQYAPPPMLIVLTKSKFDTKKDVEAFETDFGILKAFAIETPTKDESVWYDALPVFDIYKEWQDGTWR